VAAMVIPTSNQDGYQDKNRKGGWNLKKIFSSETQMVSDKKIFMGIPLGFYVKLSSAVAAILVGGLKCRTQFWKGTTDSHWMVLFQNCVWWSCPLTKMAAQLNLV
jgi:hypothetical protein